jgi:hypothetical protein
MLALTVHLDGQNCWPDLQESIASGRLTWCANDGKLSIACLPDGTVGGKPSVAIRIDLPDGRSVVKEMTMANFLAAAQMISARYGEACR